MGAFTWNPDDKHPNIVLSGSNLTAGLSTQTFSAAVRCTDGKSTGKWYFELVYNFTDNTYIVGGIAQSTTILSGSFLGSNATGWGVAPTQTYHNGSSIGSSTFYTGNVVMVAVDLDAGKIWFGYTGSWIGVGADPEAGAVPRYSDVSGTVYAAASLYKTNHSITLRTLAADFSYTPPSGFLPYATDLGTITGVVYEKVSGVFVPGAYPVYLYRRSDGFLVSTTTSAVDGSYSLTNVRVADELGDPIEYYVVALDNSVPVQRAALEEQIFVTAD